MALLLLVSTTSWKVEKHFCMGRVMDIALFTAVEKCGMELSTEDGESLQKMPCCDDEIIVASGQDDLKISLDDLSLEQHLFLTAYAHTYLNLFEGLERHFIPFDQYPPPKLIADIQLLDQVFLI